MAALRSASTRCLLASTLAATRARPRAIPQHILRTTTQFRSSLYISSLRHPSPAVKAISNAQFRHVIRQVNTKTVNTKTIGPSAGGSGPYDKRDVEAEAKMQKTTLIPTPETVSTTSSTQSILSSTGGQQPLAPPSGIEEPDIDMLAAVRSDINTIQDTFSLKAVPRDAMIIGLAGVVPYFVTSAGTFLCASEIITADTTATGYLFTAKGAEMFLQILEPLQVGYGAVILSFLGAVHWGMEWAGYGGHHSYKRYAIGVFATAFAWPTILLEAETALISQFAAFVLLYYADTAATVRGWAPPWYSTYRFVLTFVVGAAICVSLIARSMVKDKVVVHRGPMSRFRNFTDELRIEKNKGEKIQAEEGG